MKFEGLAGYDSGVWRDFALSSELIPKPFSLNPGLLYFNSLSLFQISSPF